jgi:hypothetical protein
MRVADDTTEAQLGAGPSSLGRSRENKQGGRCGRSRFGCHGECWVGGCVLRAAACCVLRAACCVRLFPRLSRRLLDCEALVLLGILRGRGSLLPASARFRLKAASPPARSPPKCARDNALLPPSGAPGSRLARNIVARRPVSVANWERLALRRSPAVCVCGPTWTGRIAGSTFRFFSFVPDGRAGFWRRAGGWPHAAIACPSHQPSSGSAHLAKSGKLMSQSALNIH